MPPGPSFPSAQVTQAYGIMSHSWHCGQASRGRSRSLERERKMGPGVTDGIVEGLVPCEGADLVQKAARRALSRVLSKSRLSGSRAESRAQCRARSGVRRAGTELLWEEDMET